MSSAIDDRRTDCIDLCDHRHWNYYCPEILGFESVMEKIDGGDFPVTEEEAETESRSDTEEDLNLGTKFFPPLLTTLAENGRPIFNLEKLSESDGRLRIEMVREKDEAIIRCTRSDGRLIMWFVRSDHDDVGDVDDLDQDDCDDNDDDDENE